MKALLLAFNLASLLFVPAVQGAAENPFFEAQIRPLLQ